jgi:hypothetical protein
MTIAPIQTFARRDPEAYPYDHRTDDDVVEKEGPHNELNSTLIGLFQALIRINRTYKDYFFSEFYTLKELKPINLRQFTRAELVSMAHYLCNSIMESHNGAAHLCINKYMPYIN